MDAETRAAIKYVNHLKVSFAKTMHPDMSKALDRLVTVASANDLVHSESFVVMFCGWCRGRLPELEGTPKRFLLDAWETFKQEMGKAP